MEENNVFEADAALNNNVAGTSKSASGFNATATATGDISVQQLPDEGTPLLARRDSLQGSEDGGDDERQPLTGGEPTWSHFADRPWWRRPSIFWVLFPFSLSAMAFGGAMVPKINIVLSLLCERYFASQQLEALPIVVGGDNAQCQIPEVQELVSSFMLIASAAAGIISAVVAPLLGSYSDRHGRVKVIAFTASGSIVADLITIVVARRSDVLSVYWLLAAYIIEGSTGTFIASIALTYAYASDCTDPRKRGVVFGYVQGGLFTGIALGPLLASYIVKATDDILSVIYIQVAAHTFFVLWNSLVVPESLTKERQFAAQEKYGEERRKAAALTSAAREGARGYVDAVVGRIKRFFHGDFFASLGVLWPTGPGTTSALRRNLVLLAGIDTCMFAVGMGLFTVLIIYSEMSFHWGNFETQMLTAAINIVRVCLLLGGLPLVARLRPRPPPSSAHGAPTNQVHAGADRIDLTVIRVSVMFDLLGYVGFGLARTGSAFLAAGVFAAFGSMASPTLASALTKHVPPDRIGRLLGASALLHAVARVGGPAIFNGVYYLTVKRFPQAIFVVLVALFSLVVVGSWLLKPNVYFDESDAPPIEGDGSEDREQGSHHA